MVTETEAVVIRTYNLAEADKIVVCLTRKAGLVRAVAKGARRIKNRFGAALEPFTLINLTYYQKENQELGSIRQAEIFKSNFNVSRDLDVLTGLAYMGDLIMDFSPPHQINDKLYRMLTACIDEVAHSPGEIQIVLRYFEVWVLRLEGFLPDLKRCVNCGRDFNDGQGVTLSRDLDLICRACAHGKDEVLSWRAYAALCATQVLNPKMFVEQSRELPKSVQRELAELMNRMIGRVLERRPRVQLAFQTGK